MNAYYYNNHYTLSTLVDRCIKIARRKQVSLSRIIRFKMRGRRRISTLILKD